MKHGIFILATHVNSRHRSQLDMHFVSHQSLYNVQLFCEGYKQASSNVMMM